MRTQKRKSVRAKCQIQASLYVVTANSANNSSVETQEGYKCIIEDISESGALVHIAGKGQPNIQIKLQFNIQNKLVIMLGIIRTVEYNCDLNESLLHFECLKIEPAMKNEILGFVYNTLPSEEREVYEALSMTDEDKGDEAEAEELINQIDAEANKKLNGDVTIKSKNTASATASASAVDEPAPDELPVVIKGSSTGKSDSIDSVSPDASSTVQNMHQVTFNQRTNLDDFDDNK